MINSKCIYFFIIVFIFLSTSCDRNSKHEEYYSSGELKWEGLFLDNKKNGKWINFDKYGNKSRIFTYKDDKLLLKETYINDMLAISEKMNGDVKNGITIVYYSNGNVKSKSNFINGEQLGESSEYYENGILHGKQTYLKDNGLVDLYQYYPNGKIFVYAKDYRNGIINVYDSLGNQIYDFLKKNNVLVDTLKIY